jgi:drug/metabolite transporter (DMT)-like permease
LKTAAAADAPASPWVNPLLVLALGACAVSTGAIFARLADAPALVVSAYRVGIAAALIAPVAIWKNRAELRALDRRDLAGALLAGFFLAIHFAVWISSLSYTSVANSTVLVNTIPIWVGLLGPLLARERVSRRTQFSIGLSFAGAVIIAFGDFSVGGPALLGDALALAGAVCCAVYILIGRNLRRKLSLLSYIFTCYGSAALILWALVLLLGLPLSGFTPQTYGAFLGMAVVSQIIGHSSYNWALRWMSAGMVALALLAEPIGATILAYFLFDEGLTWYKFFGGVIILCGIFIAARAEKG